MYIYIYSYVFIYVYVCSICQFLAHVVYMYISFSKNYNISDPQPPMLLFVVLLLKVSLIENNVVENDTL